MVIRFLVVLLSLSISSAAADFCTTINSAMLALPASGGVVDERSVTGPQTCAMDPFTNVNAPIALLLGNLTITSTQRWQLPANTTILGASRSATIINFQLGSN